MTNKEAIEQLKKEHDLIAGEYELDGSQFAPEMLEALELGMSALEVDSRLECDNCKHYKRPWNEGPCGSCTHKNSHYEPVSWSEINQDQSSDCISRQDAVEAADAIWTITGDKNVAKVWQQLKDLPSAQPERKKGDWNTIQGDIVVCSICGMSAPKTMTGCLVNRHLEPNKTNFCPNCGADMRGEQDG